MKKVDLRTIAQALSSTHQRLAIDCLRAAGYTEKAAVRALASGEGVSRKEIPQ